MAIDLGMLPAMERFQEALLPDVAVPHASEGFEFLDKFWADHEFARGRATVDGATLAFLTNANTVVARGTPWVEKSSEAS